MDESRLAIALSTFLEDKLAREICHEFVCVRRDCATGILERSSPGKFVESYVQCLQWIEEGQYDEKPSVDAYLAKTAENLKRADEGLRVCGARIARSIYTLRNKRNIAHKNKVDVNRFDLIFCHQGAAWIMAEMLRHSAGISMEEAGVLITMVQTPVGTLVEEIDGVRLVYADVSTQEEILILLHSVFPNRLSAAEIASSLKSRSPRTVRNRLVEMLREKSLHGDPKLGYRLTSKGYERAASLIISIQKQTNNK